MSDSKKMSSGTKWGIATIVLGVVAFGGIMIYVSKKTKAAAAAGGGRLVPVPGTGTGGSTTTSGGSGGSFTPTTTKPASVFTGSFPLKNGSRDTSTSVYPVKRLQWALQGLGKSIAADGIFGPKTEAALVSVTGKKTVDSEAELASIESKQYQPPPQASFFDIMGMSNLFN